MVIHNLFFFFNDTATTEIYTLSLHDALPIFHTPSSPVDNSLDDTSRPTRDVHTPHREPSRFARGRSNTALVAWRCSLPRSEEHTSELQSRQYLVCRLLLEKKKNNTQTV